MSNDPQAVMPSVQETTPAAHPASLGLSGFFRDDDGAFSMMRLILFVGIIGTLAVWGACCLVKREFIDMPLGMLGFHGMLITGKCVQNKQENAP